MSSTNELEISLNKSLKQHSNPGIYGVHLISDFPENLSPQKSRKLFTYNSLAEVKYAPVSSACPRDYETSPFSSGCPADIKLAPLSAACPSAYETHPLSSSCPSDVERAPFTAACPYPKFQANLNNGLQMLPSIQTLSIDGSFVEDLGFKNNNYFERSSSKMFHVFSLDEIDLVSARTDCHAIIAHGISKITPGFKYLKITTEHAPVFVSTTNPVQNIGFEEILDILRGKIKSWNDLGVCFDSPLQIYLNGGYLQRRKFCVLLNRLSIPTDELKKTKPIYGDSYDDLELLASKDPGAIVFGLKTPSLSGLRVVKVNNELPCISNSYPIGLPIYFFQRDSNEGKYFRKVLSNRLTEMNTSFVSLIQRDNLIKNGETSF